MTNPILCEIRVESHLDRLSLQRAGPCLSRRNLGGSCIVLDHHDASGSYGTGQGA